MIAKIGDKQRKKGEKNNNKVRTTVLISFNEIFGFNEKFIRSKFEYILVFASIELGIKGVCCSSTFITV